MNIFEQAARQKIRFESVLGLLCVEDLWDLPLTSLNSKRANLDDIANLRELVPQGLEGAIVGKALYAKAFTLRQALDVASG